MKILHLYNIKEIGRFLIFRYLVCFSTNISIFNILININELKTND